MTEMPVDDDRERRVREAAARVEADGQAARVKPSRKPREPEHPKVERATEQLQRIEADLDQLQQTLKGEPIVAALVQSVRQRIDLVTRGLMFDE